MSIGKNIIIPVLLALTTTGSVLGGVAMSSSAAQASVAPAHTTTISTNPMIRYHA